MHKNHRVVVEAIKGAALDLVRGGQGRESVNQLIERRWPTDSGPSPESVFGNRPGSSQEPKGEGFTPSIIFRKPIPDRTNDPSPFQFRDRDQQGRR